MELGWNGWPGPDFTVQDNVQDLAEHFAEFEGNEAYAYSVMSGERCIGCVYIEPWMDGAQLAFWVVDDVLGREGEIVDSVLDWLVGWPVQAVVVPVRQERGRTVQQLTSLGLRRVPGPAGHVSFRR
ncbi:MAG: hypothetical protein GY913_35255 [Proteobacteria bacterium]|nr:hypothetical protein [Pseudomonadota bacterium]MCP4922189.1 hypothetical protein [Pseudomonadota bacterium]